MNITGFEAPIAPRSLAATLPGLARMNLPEFPSVSSGFHPAQVLGGCPCCFAHVPLREPTQPALKGDLPFPERNWLGGAGSLCEAEDQQHRCLSEASFDAARGKQNRLPADETAEAKGEGGLLKLGSL